MTAQDYIAHVVQAFYGRATTDILIGYHFRHIADFDTHLPRINAFWEMQLLLTTDKLLSPPLDLLNAHVPLKIHRGEVGRWVKLFQETLDEQAVEGFAELSSKWREKLLHFQQVFLQAPKLFPKA